MATTTTTAPLVTLTVYPTVGYKSWISEAEADEYFQERLHVEEWDALDSITKGPALLMAFRSLQELDLDILWKVNATTGHKELSDSYTAIQKAAILTALQHAQCEEALHHVKNDVDQVRFERVDLGSGLISASLDPKDNPPRYAPRAIDILYALLKRRTVSRYR
jgi:hypothetical protein